MRVVGVRQAGLSLALRLSEAARVRRSVIPCSLYSFHVDEGRRDILVVAIVYAEGELGGAASATESRIDAAVWEQMSSDNYYLARRHTETKRCCCRVTISVVAEIVEVGPTQLLAFAMRAFS